MASSALFLASGCATGPGGNGSPPPVGNTHATLLITATNNAQIPIYKLNLTTLTLVAKDGTLVPVLTTPQLVELGSINGVARPLVSVDIPQGTYTSAKLAYGQSTFVVIDHSSGPTDNDIGNYTIFPSPPVTLTFNTPITVTGNAIGLLLDLDIPKSTVYTPFFSGSSYFQPNGGDVIFNPVYSLSTITLAGQPSTLKDGMAEDVHGQVSANSGSVLTMTSDSGSSLSFTTSASTAFAGPNGTTPPSIGDFVDVNAALQQDGTMSATLVQTEGSNLQNAMSGQIIDYHLPLQELQSTGREQQGPDLPNATGFFADNVQFNSSTQFEIAWPNGLVEAGLPFTPAFSAAALLPGQNVATPANSLQSSSVIPVTNTITLEPQTIDATVTSVSAVNGETSYQVTLFANDFITLFGPSNSVVVYVTPHTHTITSSTLGNGSVGRFRGLLFNDGGTLRMVATDIEDGVPAS